MGRHQALERRGSELAERRQGQSSAGPNSTALSSRGSVPRQNSRNAGDPVIITTCPRSLGSSIAYAYLPAEHDVGTEVAVEIFGKWIDGVVAEEPLFDPAGERIRA